MRTISRQWSFKRHMKQIAGVGSGAMLGFVTGNVPGAFLGGHLANIIMKNQDGDKYDPVPIVRTGAVAGSGFLVGVAPPKVIGSVPGDIVGSAPGGSILQPVKPVPVKPSPGKVSKVRKYKRRYIRRGHVYRKRLSK